jgi:Ran GTPase-activating protein (RanGAP) involved in mRNA processing and transport
VEDVTEIDVSYSAISDAGAAALAETLRSSTTIQFVNLAYNDVGPAGAAALADALMLNSSLVGLSLRGNPIGEAGGAAIASAMRANTSLMSLDLGQCELTTRALVPLFLALGPHQAICSLKIDKPLLPAGPQDVATVVQHLAQLLKANPNLVELSLDRLGLTDEHLQLLLGPLVQCDALRVLSLCGNRLGPDGGVLIGRILGRRPDLVQLSADGNRLCDDGAAALAGSLMGHPGLRHLSLRHTNMGDRGLAAIIDAAAGAPALQVLQIWGGHRFEARAAEALKKASSKLDALDLVDVGVALDPKTGEATAFQR